MKYSVLLSCLGLLAVTACSSFESHEERRAGLEMPPETIDLTVPQEGEPFDEVLVEVPPVYEEEKSPVIAPEIRSYYPSMRGYRVNRNVEVFPLDPESPIYGYPTGRE